MKGPSRLAACHPHASPGSNSVVSVFALLKFICSWRGNCLNTSVHSNLGALIKWVLRVSLLGAGALNLSQYSGIWGGKWCNSSFDPPPPANTPAKPTCPVIPGYPVPSFTPVAIPAISSLDNGTINISNGNSTVPLELKVSTLKASSSDQPESASPLTVKSAICLRYLQLAMCARS